MGLEFRPLLYTVFSHWLSLSWNMAWHLWCLKVSSPSFTLWSIQTALAITGLGYKDSKHKAFFHAIQPLKQFSSKFSRHLQGQSSGWESWAQGRSYWAQHAAGHPLWPWSRACRTTLSSQNSCFQHHRGKYSSLKEAPSPPQLAFLLAPNLSEPFKSEGQQCFRLE